MRRWRIARKGEPSASSPLEAHAMEQLSNSTGALSVTQQVDVGRDVKSVSVVCYDAESTATESPGASLLECAEVLWH